MSDGSMATIEIPLRGVAISTKSQTNFTLHTEENKRMKHKTILKTIQQMLQDKLEDAEAFCGPTLNDYETEILEIINDHFASEDN